MPLLININMGWKLTFSFFNQLPAFIFCDVDQSLVVLQVLVACLFNCSHVVVTIATGAHESQHQKIFAVKPLTMLGA